ESYQGIDLLLESFVIALSKNHRLRLAIIGGETSDIVKYKTKADQLNINQFVRFYGPRPVFHLHGYLKQADILVSPRIKGGNTPMKVYSYLASGIVLLATDLDTHTQVMDNTICHLA